MVRDSIFKQPRALCSETSLLCSSQLSVSEDPDAVRRSSRCTAEPGPIGNPRGAWTPDQQRITPKAACCAASGARKHASTFPRREAPELCKSSALENQRAQGKPGARCT